MGFLDEVREQTAKSLADKAVKNTKQGDELYASLNDKAREMMDYLMICVQGAAFDGKYHVEFSDHGTYNQISDTMTEIFNLWGFRAGMYNHSDSFGWTDKRYRIAWSDVSNLGL